MARYISTHDSDINAEILSLTDVIDRELEAGNWVAVGFARARQVELIEERDRRLMAAAAKQVHDQAPIGD